MLLNAMKFAPLLLAFLLIGCEKKIRTSLSYKVEDVSPKLVVYKGQSNAGRIDAWGGNEVWRKERGINDVMINCAAAGANIDEFGETDGVMRRCLAQLDGRVPDLIIWYQGESDAVSGRSDVHEMKTIDLFRRLRARWPNVKIIYCQLHSVDLARWPGHDKWDEIKAQQAGYSFPNSVMVRTDDIHPGPLEDEGDGIHYAQAGVELLAIRLAKTYRQMLRGEI